MAEDIDLSKYGVKDVDENQSSIINDSDPENIQKYGISDAPKMVDTIIGQLPDPMSNPQIFNKDVLNEVFRSGVGGMGGIGIRGPIFGSQYALGKPIVQHLESLGLNLEKTAPKIARMIGSVENPLSGAMIGGSMNPVNPLLGMALGGALGAVPGIAGKTFNAIKQIPNLFRGNQTNEQLQNVLSQTEGTETPIGDVLQNPFLKGMYENVISKIPFSGAYESMQRTGRQIIDKGRDIMKSLLGSHSPENVEGELYNTLVQAKEFHTKLKNEFYKEPDKIADNIKLKLDLPNFSRLANQTMEAIEGTNILQTEPQFKTLLNKLRNYISPVKEIKSTIVSKEGKPLVSGVQYPTLKEANILSSMLEDLGEKYSSSVNTAERNLSSVFKNLAKALKGDVKTAVNSSGNKELISSFNAAEQNYAKNYSPFLEKEIYNFANGKGDPDMIVQAFIKTGKATDRANLLEKFTSKLPEDKRKLLGYAFLKRAFNENGEINPLMFKQLISTKSLGTRQFNLLFPGKLGKELRDYASLIEKNPEAFQVMNNPKTGQRMLDLAAAAGIVTHPIITGASIAAGRAANKLMTSPTIRKKVINKLIDINKE